MSTLTITVRKSYDASPPNPVVAGVIVQMFDINELKSEPLAVAMTDGNGEADLVFDQAAIESFYGSAIDGFYFRVLQSGRLIADTLVDEQDFAGEDADLVDGVWKHNLEFPPTMELDVLATIQTAEVKVADAVLGAPVVGAVVEAVEVSSGTVVAEGETGPKGSVRLQIADASGAQPEYKFVVRRGGKQAIDSDKDLATSVTWTLAAAAPTTVAAMTLSIPEVATPYAPAVVTYVDDATSDPIAGLFVELQTVSGSEVIAEAYTNRSGQVRFAHQVPEAMKFRAYIDATTDPNIDDTGSAWTPSMTPFATTRQIDRANETWGVALTEAHPLSLTYKTIKLVDSGDSTTPLSGYKVRAYETRGGPDFERGRFVTDKYGRFVISTPVATASNTVSFDITKPDDSTDSIDDESVDFTTTDPHVIETAKVTPTYSTYDPVSALDAEKTIYDTARSTPYKHTQQYEDYPNVTVVDTHIDYREALVEARTIHNLTWDTLARRKAGLPYTADLGSVELDDLCACKDCAAADGVLAYLAELLGYAEKRVEWDNGSSMEPATIAVLEGALYQPFGSIEITCDAVETEVSQAMIGVEVLRRLIEDTGGMPTRAAIVEDEQVATARVEAYFEALARMGTSYHELRTAPRPTSSLPDAAKIRADLARRLRIPEETIEELLLNPGDAVVDSGTPETSKAVAEQKLEYLFGLRATEVDLDPEIDGTVPALPDPLAAIGEPLLVTRRREYLTTKWQGIDRPASASAFLTPILEPDIIGMGEVRPKQLTTGEANPAVALLVARREHVDARLATLAGVTQTLDDILAETTLGITSYASDLAPLVALRDELKEFEPQLAQFCLTPTELAFLEQFDDTTSPEADEFEELHSLLVMAEKRKMYVAWRAEEADENDIVLSPDFFQIVPVIDWHVADGGLPAPFLRRFDGAARARFERTLASRTADWQKAEEEVAQLVVDIENEYRPRLRAALIEIFDDSDSSLADKAEAIADQMLIDMQTDGCMRTSRPSQAIDTLQELLFSASTGQLENEDFEVDLYDFDEVWPWLGSLQTWRSSIDIYLHPENYLEPTLRRVRSQAFLQLDRDTRSFGSTSAQGVREAAQRFTDRIARMAEMPLVAACTVRGRLYADNESAKLVARTTMDFVYALEGTDRPVGGHSTQSRARRLYFSALLAEDGGGARTRQTEWVVVPGLSEHDVREVHGAVPIVPREPGQGQGPARVLVFLTLANGDFGFIEHVPVAYEKYTDVVESTDGAREFQRLSIPPGQLRTVAVRETLVEEESVLLAFQTSEGLFLRETRASGWVGGTSFRRQPLELDGFKWLYDFDGEVERCVHLSGDQNVVVLRGRRGDHGRRNVPRELVVFLHMSGSELKGIYYQGIDGEVCGISMVTPGTFLLIADSDDGHQAMQYEIDWDVPAVGLVGEAPTNFTRAISSFRPAARFVPQSGRARQAMYGTISEGSRRRSVQLVLGSAPALQLQQAVDITPTLFGMQDATLAAPPLSQLELERRHAAMADVFRRHRMHGTRTTRRYLTELFFHAPLLLALRLHRSGEFERALEWFRTVFDFGSADRREIYVGLQDDSGADDLDREEWFEDPMNPHGVAAMRAHSYTRFTLRAIAECLMDYAEDEFARDTPDSLVRARRLYETALDVLAEPQMGEESSACATEVHHRSFVAHVPDAHPLDQSALTAFRRALEGVNGAAARTELAEDIDGALDPAEHPSDSVHQRLAAGMNEAAPPAMASTSISQTISVSQELIDAVGADDNTRSLVDAARLAVVAQFKLGVSELTAILPEDVEANVPAFLVPFGTDSWMHNSSAILAPAEHALFHSAQDLPLTADGLPNSKSLREILDPLFSSSLVAFVPEPRIDFCVPANPAFAVAKDRARAGLRKLRDCLTLDGQRRPAPLYRRTADGDVRGARAGSFAPTQYRFSALIQRTLELSALSEQLEAAYLRAREAFDEGQYRLIDAQEGLELSEAGVSLEELRVDGARLGVRIAGEQYTKSTYMADHFKDLMAGGLLPEEQRLQTFLERGREIGERVAKQNRVATSARGIGAVLGAAGGIVSSIVVENPLAVVGASLSAAEAITNAAANEATAKAQMELALNQANVPLAQYQAERAVRQREWGHQAQLAGRDQAIAGLQIDVARNGVEIAEAQLDIASLRMSFAEAKLNFLVTKFSSAAFYDWMADVLVTLFRWTLRTATSVAKLAELQLAFERQEVVPAFIQSNYWALPADTRANEGAREGITGSARLRNDVEKLRQHAFVTKARRQHLSKNVSLAAVAPEAMHQLRQHGVAAFVTTLDQFDRDFPAHYLRLIERVRINVIALTSANEGIRATLKSSGISSATFPIHSSVPATQRRVPTTDYQPRYIWRDAQEVAFSTTRYEGGVSQLEANEQELLLPFEGLGVATDWTLEIPKASNVLDYSTIMDVVLTIDYSALSSAEKASQVSERMGPRQEERWFSFRNFFVDAMYTLENTDVDDELSVVVELEDIDFVYAERGLKLTDVSVIFSTKDGMELPVTSVSLSHTPVDGTQTTPEVATTYQGVATTRRGEWDELGLESGLVSPLGHWTITFPDSDDAEHHIRTMLDDESLEDIYLSVSYTVGELRQDFGSDLALFGGHQWPVIEQPALANFAGLTQIAFLSDTITGYADQDPLDSWVDVGPNAIEITASDTERPTYVANGELGPCVRGDGSNDFLASAGSLGIDMSGGLTIFTVHARASYGAFEGMLACRADNDTRQQQCVEVYQSNTAQWWVAVTDRDPGPISYWSANDADLNTTDPVLWSIRMDGTNLAHTDFPWRQNGDTVAITVTEQSTPDGPANDVDIIELLHGYDGNNFDGDLYAVVLYYGRPMTLEEVEIVEAQLNARFGVY